MQFLRGMHRKVKTVTRNEYLTKDLILRLQPSWQYLHLLLSNRETRMFTRMRLNNKIYFICSDSLRKLKKPQNVSHINRHCDWPMMECLSRRLIMFCRNTEDIKYKTAKRNLCFYVSGLVSFINFRSVKVLLKMQNIFSSFKILVCLIVIGGGAYNIYLGNTVIL